MGKPAMSAKGFSGNRLEDKREGIKTVKSIDAGWIEPM
jgi:hypothetical protein